MSGEKRITRPKCDICMKRNADIKEEGVNFCALHYDAWMNLKKTRRFEEVN